MTDEPVGTPEAVDVESKETDGTTRRLTPAQWAEMTALYEVGEMSLKDLSDKFGVSVSAISKKFRRDNVKRGSKAKAVIGNQVAQQVAQNSAQNAVNAADENRRRIEETKTQSYKSATMIHIMAHKLIVDAANNGARPATIDADLKALKIAADIFEKTRAQRYAILNIDADIEEDRLPTIMIEDLTESEIDEMRSSQEEEFGDLIEGDDDDDDIEDESLDDE